MAATRTIIRWLRRTLIGLAGIVAVISGLWAFNRFVWFPYQYPYGWSHSCDAILHSTLTNHAMVHDGEFPSGEDSPEASLSTLARKPWRLDAEILRGKTVPKEVVEEILERDELLGPETCGWHYVEGLREDDDPRIAIFWDKTGLGHNGQRLPNGDRIVSRIKETQETIPGPEWKSFLQEQKMLLEKLPEDRRRLAMKNFPE